MVLAFGLSLESPKMLKPVAVRGAYESRKRQTCLVPEKCVRNRISDKGALTYILVLRPWDT